MLQANLCLRRCNCAIKTELWNFLVMYGCSLAAVAFVCGSFVVIVRVQTLCCGFCQTLLRLLEYQAYSAVTESAECDRLLIGKSASRIHRLSGRRVLHDQSSH